MPARPERRRRRIALGVVLGLGLLGFLGGLCGCSQTLEQVAMGGAPRPMASASVPTRNDLADGALTKKLLVGDAVLTVSYSSTLPAERWTAAEEKPLDIAVTAELTRGAAREVYLSLVRVRYAVTGHSAVLPAPAPVTDRAFGTPGFPIGMPERYRQTLMLPPLEDAADTVHVELSYTVTLQAAPGLSRYLRQTVTDDLTIAIAR
jgi:hypothetical protein